MQHSIRKWALWPGQSFFYCNGRVRLGPDYWGAAVSLVAINTIGTAQLYYIAWEYWQHYSLPALLVLSAFLQASTSLLLFAVATSDPGFLPRQDLVFAIGPAGQPPLGALPGVETLRTDVNVNGMMVKMKVCQTCRIVRPPRASHCTKCDMCVERFDHHCPWLGNCIGLRNYFRFFSFLSLFALYCSYSFALCLALCLLQAKGDLELEELLTTQAPAIAFGTVSLSAAVFTTGLLVYHSVLTATNQTTYERIKASNRENRSFDLGGAYENCLFMLFPPLKALFRIRFAEVIVPTLARSIPVSPKQLLFGDWERGSGGEAEKQEVVRPMTGGSTRLWSREEGRRTRKVSPMHGKEEDRGEWQGRGRSNPTDYD